MARKAKYSPPAAWRRSPKNGVCTNCRADVLVCLYDGFDVIWDKPALSLAGEAAALLAGHDTYHWAGSGVHKRSAAHIHLEPRPLMGTVHRSHRCGDAIQDGHKKMPKPVNDSDDPGF